MKGLFSIESFRKALGIEEPAPEVEIPEQPEPPKAVDIGQGKTSERPAWDDEFTRAVHPRR